MTCKVPALLPENHRIRLALLAGNFQFLPFKRLIWILFSLLVGSFTHLARDSFTRDGGFFVELFPIPKNQLFVVGQIHMDVYLLFSKYQYNCRHRSFTPVVSPMVPYSSCKK